MVNKPVYPTIGQVDDLVDEVYKLTKAADPKAYMREYMRKRRAAKKPPPKT